MAVPKKTQRTTVLEFRTENELVDKLDAYGRTVNMSRSQVCRAIIHSAMNQNDGKTPLDRGYQQGWTEGLRSGTTFVQSEIQTMLSRLADNAKSFSGAPK
jgi:hypothetical protein